MLTKPQCLYGASMKANRGKTLLWELMALRTAYSGAFQSNADVVPKSNSLIRVGRGISFPLPISFVLYARTIAGNGKRFLCVFNETAI
jgi:hypothetical protein